MSERKVTQIRRKLRLAGVPAVAGRVHRRLLKLYRATPWRQRHAFDAVRALQRASGLAFSSFFHRLTPVERAKFLKKAAKAAKKEKR